MKLKTLTLATLSAIYGAGMATAVLATPGTTTEAKLNPIKLPSAEFMEQQRQRINKNGNAVKRNNGVNVQLKRNSPDQKFMAKAEDAQGEFDYIVELYGDTVIEQQRALASSQNVRTGATANTKATGTKRLGAAAFKSPTASSQEYKLMQAQDKLLSSASSVVGRQLTPKMRYSKVLNGFSVKMSQAEAVKLSTLPQVKKITKSQMYHLQTDYGPTHIGADKVWSGENVNNTPYQGEGIVVGIVDTGINTDHRSFKATGDDGYTVSNPLGAGNYLGDCAKSEFADRCNDKLIGVFSYEKITDVYSAEEFQAPDHLPWDPLEEIRPRFGEDYAGHGSHTASTAAGNVVLNAPYQQSGGAMSHGIDTGFTFDRVSGVAPHANIVAFQVCYPGGAGDVYVGCPGDVLVQGIEDAITAGVDVINFSIGGQENSPWESPLEQAFLNAHEAGVLVAVAAGNNGSNGHNEIFSYIDHSSPWLLNVAAATSGRTIEVVGKSLTNFNSDSTSWMPSTIQGKSLSGGIVGNVVYAANYPDPDTSDAYSAASCNVPFPAGTFQADDIVICDRGDIARVAKADNVKAGGAGGFILANTNWDTSVPEGMTFNDIYSVPGIHIGYNDAYYLKQWVGTGTFHTAEITASHIERTIDESQADILADFSSRGPSNYVEEHLIPMITAPGVNIFAANSDDQPFNVSPTASDWTMMSGTSMASPHVAGAMALVRQAHPDWTASELQNAMQMTAVQDVRFRPYSWAELEDAGTYRAGSGRVDVLAAINSGLLLDETIDNFRNADPANGGMVRQLNMPELVNMHCGETCTWVRTFKAVRDGDWSVEAQGDEVSLSIEAKPANFSLKAGQTQSVVFTAKILNSQSRVSNSEAEVWGSVRLVPRQMDIPSVYLPVAVKYDNRNMPDAVGFVVNRDQGEHQISNLMLPEVSTPVYAAAAPVKAEVRDVTLPQKDPEGDPWYVCGYYCSHEVDATSDVSLVTVPEGTSRLMVEVLARSATTAPRDKLYYAGDADVFIGFDANGDGQPQWDEEAICASSSEAIVDYCNINNPQPGQYWVVVNNFQHSYEDPKATFDTYKVATAIVGKDGSNQLTATGPAQLDGLNAADISLRWDLEGAVKGDVYYSMLQVGTDATQPDNIAQIPLRMVRGDNEVSLMGSQTQARAGDVVNMRLHVMENLDGYDHEIGISSMLPDNLALVPGSVKVSKAINAEGLTVTDNGFSLTSMQPHSEDWAKEYKVTTSDNDAMCHMPNYGQSKPNGYMDLWELGLNPIWGGNWNETLQLPLSWYYGNGAYANLYNNQDPDGQFTTLTVSPIGLMQLDDMPLFWPDQYPMNFQGFPDALIAPLWRGITFNSQGDLDWRYFRTPYNVDLWSPKNNSGITMGFTGDGRIFTEWDNARTTYQDYDWLTGQTSYSDAGDSYDFEMMLNLNYDFSDGGYEVIMAYDNIDFANEEGLGAIGIHGFDGFRGVFGPEKGWLGTEFGFNDLKGKLKNDLVVCYDYVGPESSQFDIDFQVMVKNDAAGNQAPIEVSIERSGLPSEMVAHYLNVPSNIKVGAIGSQTIAEDTKLEGIVVAYSDDNTVANTISVSGEHVTGFASGNEPGATVTVVPEANFTGKTTVTITVADSKNPSDAASTSFELTVTPVADAPIAKAANMVDITEGQTATLDGSASMDPDGDSMTYSWSGSDGSISNANAAVATVSGLAVGEHQFTLTVSDGTMSNSVTTTVKVSAAPVAVEPAKDSSGGAAGMLLLLTAPLAWLRRRKVA
ncbi:S8 family serine peptidase [Shewanella cyperi]|uniref:S8 family serine peptidase n=1 Tax=Shewanella cyperi TaxID=2814292 RepID=A0A975AJG7_9GAMM|nr:S8 family peptidase [Shewanella cyperi]QSX28696.1 S8 family serine peptidase [Shewanella cyperi]